MPANPKGPPSIASLRAEQEGYGDWKQEAGQWLGLLRDQWFSCSPFAFHWTARFFFLFLGAFVYSVAFVLIVYLSAIFPLALALPIDLLFFAVLVPCVLSGMFCAGLLCWIDRRAGPARLFLSGLAFPALVFVIFRFSVGEELLRIAFGVSAGGE